jgi:hypothetical protein
MEPLAKVELVLSSRSSIALTLRKPFAEPDPTGKLRLTSIFQRMVDFFSADLDINLFNYASLPANRWAPFFVFGGSIRRISSILFGLASIPFVDTRQPRNLPFFTPKTHFYGFNFRPACLKLANVSCKSAI